jgi:hypothetical protein
MLCQQTYHVEELLEGITAQSGAPGEYKRNSKFISFAYHLHKTLASKDLGESLRWCIFHCSLTILPTALTLADRIHCIVL